MGGNEWEWEWEWEWAGFFFVVGEERYRWMFKAAFS